MRRDKDSIEEEAWRRKLEEWRVIDAERRKEDAWRLEQLRQDRETVEREEKRRLYNEDRPYRESREAREKIWQENQDLKDCVSYIKFLLEDDTRINRDNTNAAKKTFKRLSPEGREVAESKIVDYIWELKKRKPLTEKIKIFIRDISDNISEKLGIPTERVEIKRTLRKILDKYDDTYKTQAEANSETLASIHNKVGFKTKYKKVGVKSSGRG
jgi:hypothetical protein